MIRFLFFILLSHHHANAMEFTPFLPKQMENASAFKIEIAKSINLTNSVFVLYRLVLHKTNGQIFNLQDFIIKLDNPHIESQIPSTLPNISWKTIKYESGDRVTIHKVVCKELSGRTCANEDILYARVQYPSPEVFDPATLTDMFKKLEVDEYFKLETKPKDFFTEADLLLHPYSDKSVIPGKFLLIAYSLDFQKLLIQGSEYDISALGFSEIDFTKHETKKIKFKFSSKPRNLYKGPIAFAILDCKAFTSKQECIDNRFFANGAFMVNSRLSLYDRDKYFNFAGKKIYDLVLLNGFQEFDLWLKK